MEKYEDLVVISGCEWRSVWSVRDISGFKDVSVEVRGVRGIFCVEIDLWYSKE